MQDFVYTIVIEVIGMKLKDLIRIRRKELNLTLLDIAKACDVSEATVSRWESGDIGDMKRSRISSLAKILKISPSVIVGTEGDDVMYESIGIDFRRLPLYSPLCCGNGGFNDDNILEFIPVPSNGLSPSCDYFCQMAQGESMKDAGINDGDLLIFEKINYVTNGTIGCFCIDENEAMCKKYKEQDGIIILQPMNSEYDPIFIDPINSGFKCLGKLKKSIKNFNE